MTEKEIADATLTLFEKGITHDFGDTDYFYDATEDEVDRGHEMLTELQDDGRKAFVQKYGL